MTHQQVDVDGFLWVTSSCAIKLQSLSPDTDDPPFFNVAEKNIDAHDTYIEQNKEKQIKHNKRIKRSTEERNSKKKTKMKMKMKQRRRRLREQTRELRDRAFAQKLACKRHAHHWLVKNTQEKSLEELYHEEDDLLDVCFVCLLLVLLFVVLCMMVMISK